jgi:hypothetical protein
MSAETILTLSNGKGVDLLHVKPEDIDFRSIAEHLAKEKRFNGATPDVEYSVADHLCIGCDAIRAVGGTETEAAYFLLHDAQEGLWKDDPTPKKRAIAERVSERCGVTSEAILAVLAEIVDEHDAAIHQAAGLPWPVPEEIRRIVKLMDVVMFVTEWRDLMHDLPHPNWHPYDGVKPLAAKIEPQAWAHARAAWLLRANKLLPALKRQP